MAAFLSGAALHAQADRLEGVWQGYDGEWSHVSRQLVALAEAIPAEKFAWRPAPGVRSTSEVFMHIANANYGLLSITGPKMPDGLRSPNVEKTVTDKAEVIKWLKGSLEAVRNAHTGISSAELQRKVKVAGREANVDGIYLRIIIHANEHMGQLVAYARVNGIVPPWSESTRK
ncbi:MAG: DinB family protein [Acidobacteriales bacterium]|nr:DinB family protein [Terriglobales bacterium]